VFRADVADLTLSLLTGSRSSSEALWLANYMLELRTSGEKNMKGKIVVITGGDRKGPD
jgi:hypothetical protein